MAEARVFVPLDAETGLFQAVARQPRVMHRQRQVEPAVHQQHRRARRRRQLLAARQPPRQHKHTAQRVRVAAQVMQRRGAALRETADDDALRRQPAPRQCLEQCVQRGARLVQPPPVLLAVVAVGVDVEPRRHRQPAGDGDAAQRRARHDKSQAVAAVGRNAVGERHQVFVVGAEAVQQDNRAARAIGVAGVKPQRLRVGAGQRSRPSGRAAGLLDGFLEAVRLPEVVHPT